MREKSLIVAAALLCGLPAIASAQAPLPAPARPHAAIPEALDVAYEGGTMALDIDASDVTRGAYRVTQTIPVEPGTRTLVLLLPKWLPGNHAPRGPIAELVDLRFTAAGRPVGWRRDPYDVHAFHLDLPEGAREVEARFIHTSPLERDEGRITMTPQMLNLQWEKMSLYPAGHYVRRIRVKPSVTLPAGWHVASALGGASRRGDRVSWAETDYETLVDSPIFAGRFFRKWDLGRSIELSAVADSPDLLALRPEHEKALSAMGEEALALFGRPPFDRYEFLVALSEQLGGIGLEHLESSENQLEPLNFVQWTQYDWDRNVLAHELVHSWNGKYRRPARLWTPDYRTPMQDELLWVYEGQTQFWGWVLAARSGLQSKETVLGMIARAAGLYSQQPGREWRSVLDTTLDPIVAARKAKPYPSLARGEDYYNEGALVWLEADQLIRRETGGRKSLDDFARDFFSREGNATLAIYERGDVVAALGTVHPQDWDRFLSERLDRPGQPAPLSGIEAGGYRLVWKEQPNPYEKGRMDNGHYLDLYHSLGLRVEQDGRVSASRWEGPAFAAGIVSGARIVAVDSLAFSQAGLTRSISRAKLDGAPITLLVRRGDRFESVEVKYTGGLRWPWLEKAKDGAEAGLDRLLAPRRAAASN